jgi:hypothetical protein
MREVDPWLPLLHWQVLKKAEVSGIQRSEREVRGLEGGRDGVLLLAEVEKDQGW